MIIRLSFIPIILQRIDEIKGINIEKFINEYIQFLSFYNNYSRHKSSYVAKNVRMMNDL